MTRPSAHPRRAAVELVAAAAFAAAAYFALARPPATPPPPPPPPVTVGPSAAPMKNVDDAVAVYGAAAAALLALPYSDWAEDTDPTKLGVTVHDPKRAWPGWNLYTNGADRAFLIDNEGRRVHSWYVGGKNRCQHAELLDDGDVLLVCVNQALVRLDWYSNLVWMKHLKVHHDVGVFPDGTLVVPVAERHRSFNDWRVKFDALVELTPDGIETGRIWSTFDQFETLRSLHGPSPLDTPPPEPNAEHRDYYHLNSVEVLAPTSLGDEDPRFRAGNLLVNLRNANVVVVLERATGEVLWHWGTEELDMSHSPTLLPDGGMLIFDNGVERQYTRVIEIDPRSGEIVWQYQADPPSSFFSIWRGSAQRLSNGNTLIADAEHGRLFEITREGETVWEFWNPVVQEGKRQRIYRVFRFGVERMREIRRRVSRES